MRLHEQTPETSLGAEVHHQTSLFIDAHACWIQWTWQKKRHKIFQEHTLKKKICGWCRGPEEHNVPSSPTLQLGLRGAADALRPENGRVVHESQAKLWLQVKVLPATGSHGRVEHVWHVKRHTQSHVGLDQIQHLRGRWWVKNGYI